MTNKPATSTCVTYGLLAVACGISFLMPDSLTAPFSVAAEPGDRINLIGVIRDFSGSHSDFEARPPEGFGQTAGNVDLVLSDDGRPVFLGNEPRTVAMTEDRDLVSYWPFDEGTGTTTKDLGADNDGELQGGATWVDGRVGGAIHFDGVNDVVNVKDAPEIRVTGDVTFSGWFKLDVNHNGGSAKTQIITEKYLHNNTGFHLALIGRDYGRSEVTDGSMVFKVEHERSVRYKWTNRSAWQKGEWYHFAAVLDASDSRNNRLIINGEDDTATADAGPGNGGSLALNTNYAADLRIGGKKLDQNMGVGGLLYFQGAIDDFMVFSRVVTEEELSAAMNAGYQVTRNWTDRFSNNIAPHMYRDSDAGMPNCVVVSDRVGTAGNASDAGISSGDSFDQWFSDAMGVNLSSFHRITMVAHDSGEYRFTDEQFYPIDGTLLGNEGDSHNHNFTYHVQAIFTYDRCGNDYIQFRGGDGAWMYINGDLVLDSGGIGAAARAQFVELDRLGLTDGEEYTIDLFYAERDSRESIFDLRTSFELTASSDLSVSAPFD